MVVVGSCQHAESTLKFERGGTKLRPKAWMVEVCIQCAQEIDRKSIARSWDGAGRKGGE